MAIIRINNGINGVNGIDGQGRYVHDAVKKSLKLNEALTPAKAQRVLLGIEIKSKIQSFLTKPAVALVLSGAIAITGYVISALATFSVALAVLGIVMAVGGSLTFGLVSRLACDGTLSKMSKEYAEQAEIARNYRLQIKAAVRAGHNVQILV